MKCFECGAGRLLNRISRVEGVVKGEKFTVETKALVCDHCGHAAIEGKNAQGFMRQLSDAYREKYGLLTSKEIKEIRGRLSQQRFAALVGLGVASVKRWELGLIQDRKSNEQLIRFRDERNGSMSLADFGVSLNTDAITWRPGSRPAYFYSEMPLCTVSAA